MYFLVHKQRTTKALLDTIGLIFYKYRVTNQDNKMLLKKNLLFELCVIRKGSKQRFQKVTQHASFDNNYKGGLIQVALYRLHIVGYIVEVIQYRLHSACYIVQIT